MSIFKKLFGRGQAEETPNQVLEYNGFRIYPDPQKDGGQYRITARIELDVEGETKTHTLIRADTIAGLDEATKLTIAKAKQVIDEQGARLFS